MNPERNHKLDRLAFADSEDYNRHIEQIAPKTSDKLQASLDHIAQNPSRELGFKSYLKLSLLTN